VKLSDIFKFGLARLRGAAVQLLDGSQVYLPRFIPFNGFRPVFVASLSAGATYEQSGTTVAVTSTAHGIPAANNGMDFYWPGSAAIPQGIYSGWTYVSADVFTFTNPLSQTVAAGAAVLNVPFLGTAQCCVATVPAGAVSSDGQLTLHVSRRGDATTGVKRVYISIDGSVSLSSASLGTSNVGTVSLTYRGVGAAFPNRFVGTGGGNADGAGGSGQVAQTIDFSVDKQVYLSIALANAQQWAGVDAAYLEARRWG